MSNITWTSVRRRHLKLRITAAAFELSVAAHGECNLAGGGTRPQLRAITSTLKFQPRPLATAAVARGPIFWSATPYLGESLVDVGRTSVALW